MLILAWIIIVILFLLISNYYFYKTDSRTRKKAFLYAIIETIGAFFIGGSTWKIIKNTNQEFFGLPNMESSATS